MFGNMPDLFGGVRTAAFDSGAGGSSFTSDKRVMRGFIEQIKERVSGIDPQGEMVATGMGGAGIMVSGVLLEIDKMCYVLGLKGTLVSLSCLAEQGWVITIAKVDGVNALH